MDDTRNTPAWLTVGAEVATLRIGGTVQDRTEPTVVRFAKVAEITPRRVLLDDGQEFHLPSLRRAADGHWGPTTGLLPADHPKVLDAIKAGEHQQALENAQKRCIEFAAGTPGLTAADVIRALAPLTGVEHALAALFHTPADAEVQA